jgi:diadenosine tetraphosphatase ApaH/serine/threonine PP2A family protein phosphatase
MHGMRYAIVSDLHANAPAWRAVLLDLASMGADHVICLGDVVGYGPHPAEVLESVHARAAHILLGNHDAAFVGLMPDDVFSDDARAALAWTRTQLDAAAATAMAAWPLALRGPGFRAAHAEFQEPGRYRYLFEPEDAAPSWQAADDPLLFAGHTHVPALFILGEDGIPRRAPAHDVLIEPGRRYIVNPGAVGQPRDGDPRASYALYDTDTRGVYFRRVPFDLDQYARDAKAAALPPASTFFLQYDPRKDLRPVRERLMFRPPAQTFAGMRGAVQEAEVDALRGAARRWKAAAVGALALALASTTGALMVIHRHASPRADVLASPNSPARHVHDLPEGHDLLPPVPPLARRGAPPPGWTIRRFDRARQSVYVEPESAADGSSAFRLIAGRGVGGDLVLEAAPVAVEPGDRLTAELWVRHQDPMPRLLLDVHAEDERGEPLRTLVHMEPTQIRRAGFRSARRTFTVPARAACVRVGAVLRGEGEAAGVTVRLERRPPPAGRSEP